jgi:predicted protein tyrosine phosphatase
MSQAQKLIFICSQNKLRSLTAECLYRGFPNYTVKSAGTSPNARVRVNAGHIGWADTIFVMEKKHSRLLAQKFGETLAGRRVICLRIPDVYRYMEPALIDELKANLSPYVEVPE